MTMIDHFASDLAILLSIDVELLKTYGNSNFVLTMPQAAALTEALHSWDPTDGAEGGSEDNGVREQQLNSTETRECEDPVLVVTDAGKRGRWLSLLPTVEGLEDVGSVEWIHDESIVCECL